MLCTVLGTVHTYYTQCSYLFSSLLCFPFSLSLSLGSGSEHSSAETSSVVPASGGFTSLLTLTHCLTALLLPGGNTLNNKHLKYYSTIQETYVQRVYKAVVMGNFIDTLKFQTRILIMSYSHHHWCAWVGSFFSEVHLPPHPHRLAAVGEQTTHIEQ